MKTPEEYLKEQGVFSLDTKKRYSEVIEWMQGYAKEAQECDKNLCSDYNTLYNRCKFMNGHCSLKQQNQEKYL